MNILVPTDFSPAARSAMAYACQLAADTNGAVTLFHAYMLPTPVSEMPYAMVTADALQEENEKSLATEARKLNEKYGVPVDWVVRVGIPSSETEILAEEKNIGLVVMGMKGENGLEKLIGSTTTNTLKKIKIPVLVVPEGTVYSRLNKIALASDLNPELPQQVFDPALNLAALFGSHIDLLHVVKEEAELSGTAVSGKVRLSAILKEIPYEFHLIHENKVLDGILHYLEHHPANLLVMIHQPHHFLESLFHSSQTRKMAFETPVPLLVLHPVN